MAIAAVEQLLSYRDGELALDALPAEARARIDEVHAGASFEIGSRTASLPEGVPVQVPGDGHQRSLHIRRASKRGTERGDNAPLLG